MNDVTPEQVKEACLAAGLTRVVAHNCSICGYPCAYIIDGEQLFYDIGCDCTARPSTLEARDWSSASSWINVQQTDEGKQRVAEKFGLKVQVAP